MWGPDVNLQDYARLYGAAYRAIKDVDRHSGVIAGGLAFTRSSLPRLLHAFKGLPLDGLAVHPYAPDAAATITIVRWTQQQLVADHRGRTPLTVNEYGWNSVPKTWQAVPQRPPTANKGRQRLKFGSHEAFRSVSLGKYRPSRHRPPARQRCRSSRSGDLASGGSATAICGLS